MTSPGTETAGSLYAKALEATRPYVAAIRDDQWNAPTPCTEWSVRQLLNHTVYEIAWVDEIFAGKTVAEVGDRFEGDVLGPDPLAAYDAAAQAAKRAVLAPSAMDTVCHLRRGDTSGAAYATSMFIDVFIHGWDTAKAIGQDATLKPGLVSAAYTVVEPRKGQSQSGRAFAPQIEVPEDTDLQAKLLGILGRSADWRP